MLKTRALYESPSFSRMDPVLRRLGRRGVGSPRETERVDLLAHRLEVLPAKATIQTEGEPVRRARFLLSGWACRLRDLSDGRRQVFDFVLPGDGLGVCLRPG